MTETATLNFDDQSSNAQGDFYVDYERALSASGVLSALQLAGPKGSAPDMAAAESLALAMYDVIHDIAPDHARFAIMSSGGKDSSACVHYYVESVLARVAAGKRFVPGVIIMGYTRHEFSAVAERQRNELAALNKWGAPYGISAEIVQPRAKDTTLVELIGNGMALPAKAKNDKVVQASISNWCVDRVKRYILDAAVERAASLAPLVIQVLGTRFGESPTRDTSVLEHSAGLPEGLTRMADGGNTRFVGFMPILRFSNKLIRDFVHDRFPSYRSDGNLELEQIYREASPPHSKGGEESTECAIERTADGGFGGGCSGLASSTRLGCFVCLKSTNKALFYLALREGRLLAAEVAFAAAAGAMGADMPGPWDAHGDVFERSVFCGPKGGPRQEAFFEVEFAPDQKSVVRTGLTNGGLSVRRGVAG